MLTVESNAFKPGTLIPRRYSREGEDRSPPLHWEGAPKETKAFAIICDDPDAPRREPWVHWIVYGLPWDCSDLPEGAAGDAIEGRNDFGETGYGGPLPPRGHGAHHYHFKVFALDTRLSLKPGATKQQLLDAMRGHILDHGDLVGTYERC